MRGTPLPNPDRIRKVFFGAWAAVGALIVVALVLTAGHPLVLAPANAVSYIGSEVPTNTTFHFLVSESVALYALNLTGSSPSDRVNLTIWGNWSASAQTSVATMIGGISLGCPYPWGCYGMAGTYHGTIDIPLTISTDPATHLGVDQLMIGVVFWALSSDTVTVTSPIFAAVAP
jgi:hypothetical protein